jgi:hypothetical protein
MINPDANCGQAAIWIIAFGSGKIEKPVNILIPVVQYALEGSGGSAITPIGNLIFFKLHQVFDHSQYINEVLPYHMAFHSSHLPPCPKSPQYHH